MMAKKLVIVFTIAVLLSTVVPISLAEGNEVTTYASDDPSTPKTHFALNEEVRVFWALVDVGAGTDDLIIMVYSPTTETKTYYYTGSTGEMFLNPSVTGTWRIEIRPNWAYDYIMASCTFTVGSLVVTPENNYGSLIAITSCFTAAVAFGVIRRKGNKFTDNFHPKMLT